MTRNNDWFLKCAFFLVLMTLLITMACTAQMTAEQPEVEISPTPTSSPISLATVAIAPEKTAIIVETITPLPLKTDPAITNTLPITKTLPETVTDDLRPPRDVTPTVPPIPTPVPYPLVNPTVTHLDFISTTFHSPFTRLTEAHIFEETIFFTGRVNPSAKNPFPNAIFTHNLQTGDTELLTVSIHGEEGVICCMDVSKDWVAWLTYLPWGGMWRVCAKNLSTGEEMIIDREEDANLSTPRGPYLALSGDNLIWSSLRKLDDGSIKGYVMHYNLANQQAETIVETDWPESVGYVDIDGDRVVWSKGNVAGGQNMANVFQYNLSTHQLTQVTDDGYSGQPQINGDYLVWRQGFYDTGPIIINNLQTGKRIQLPYKGDYILLGDGLIMWSQYTGGFFKYLYDIERNIVEGIVPEDSKYYTAFPSGRQVLLIVRPNDNEWVNGTGQIEIRTYPILN